MGDLINIEVCGMCEKIGNQVLMYTVIDLETDETEYQHAECYEEMFDDFFDFDSIS